MNPVSHNFSYKASEGNPEQAQALLAVVGTINNLEKWEHFPNLTPISKTQMTDREWIVTGRIAPSNYDDLKKQDFVITLEEAEPMFPF